MNIIVKEENNASCNCDLYPHKDEDYEPKIEQMDVADQFIDETGIHDRRTWLIKDEFVTRNKSSQILDGNELISSLRRKEYETYDPKSDNPRNIPANQIRNNRRKNSKNHQLIDWQLLIKAVRRRPLLWNKFLHICENKLAKTVAWRELCLILKTNFEEMAQENQENLERPQSFEADITVFGKDQWGTYFYLKNPALAENTCNTENCQNSIGETEINSAESQPSPSVETSFLSENESHTGITQYRREKSRKRNYCYYCELPVSNFARHIERSHSNEIEVQKILSEPKKSHLRKKLLTRMRKKGNYLKSSKCSTPLKLQPNKFAGKRNVCPYCLGFYSSKQLYRHKRKCNENPDLKRNISDNDGSFDKTRNIHWALRKKVFPRMRPDNISAVSQQDNLICEFGSRYLHANRNKRSEINVTSQKMRQLARLLIEIKKRETTVTTMMDIFHPKYYDTIVAATKQIAFYDEQTKRYKSPNFARFIGISLKKCCEIAIDFTHQKRNSTENVSDAVSAIRIFSSLLEGAWKNDIFQEVPNILDTNNTPPDTEVYPESNLKVHMTVKEEAALRHNGKNTDQQAQQIAHNIGENDNTNITFENKDEIHKYTDIKQTKRKKGEKIPWTSEQKKVVSMFFKAHIENKKPPKRTECEFLKAENRELLSNKDWLKIKVFIQNVYTKKCRSYIS